MKPQPFLFTALLLACVGPSEPGRPSPHRLSPRLDVAPGVALILGQPPVGPVLRDPSPATWPPSLYLRRPIVGYVTAAPDSLASAWGSLDSEGNVRCVAAYYGPQYGYATLREEFIRRLGPPTRDSTDAFGAYSYWIDAYYAWGLGAGQGSTDTGGAVAWGVARHRGEPEPTSPAFRSPCAPR